MLVLRDHLFAYELCQQGDNMFRSRGIGFATAAVVVAVIAVPGRGEAQSAPGAYVSVNVGAFVPQAVNFNVLGVTGSIELDPGVFVSGALGYRFGNGIRVEAETDFARTRVDKIKFKTFGLSIPLGVDEDIFSVTLNAFFDISTGTIVTPYVGGGIGFAHQKFDSGITETDLTAFGEIGGAIRVDDNVDIVPAYRFVWIDTSIGDGFERTRAHVFKIGARFSF
jgi:opacity protein-like surface antigen